MYQVLIVGAGQIGAFYDRPGTCDILTHAHAFSVTGGFTLAGFVDPDPEKAEKAASAWGARSFLSLEEAFSSVPVDVVCVAVPDAFHIQTVQALAVLAVRYPFKLIFAEKPFGNSYQAGANVLAELAKRGVSVQVNYSRRFVPEFQALADRISSGAFGECLGGTGIYGKGFVHNGSHMVNLLQFLFSNADIKPGAVFSSLADFEGNDPSLGLQLLLPNRSTFILQPVDSRVVTLFEVDLLFERQRVRMLKSGFSLYYFDRVGSEKFAGHQNYALREQVDTSLGRALGYAAENIRAYLDSGVPLLSPAQDALDTLGVLEACRIQVGITPALKG